MAITFDDVTVRKLFGSEDAESEDPERLKEYFLNNGAYNDLNAPLPLRIVTGHKGVGKSALLKRAFLDDQENNILAVEIQPNDIAELMASAPDEPFIQKIERWKSGIKRIVAQKAVDSMISGSIDNATQEKFQNAGQKATAFIRRAIEIIKPNINDQANALIADSFLRDNVIRVYIDDIDRGWSASQSDISNISALLNAIRDLCNSDKGLQCRIALRTDVYFLVRTSDESTDKIEQDIIRLQWSNDEILRMITIRVMTYFNMRNLNDLTTLSQARISKEILSTVIDPIYSGRGLWENVPVSVPLMSLCRKRPRDLVKLLHAAARAAGKSSHSIIKSEDLTSAFEAYSDERLQDLVNEFRSEMPEIKNVLLKFKPSKKEKHASINYKFTTDQLINKIKNIRQQVRIEFRSGTSVSERSILSFLYKIDFIIARSESDGKAKWTYFDQRRFLANDAIDFGFQWEIHLAYRWAIQPNDIQDVIDSLDDISG
ncbi:hypothetical protein [Sphingopyxis sp. L1A2A]|uniref:P-loop ATPase, Sll1717 family n=1 Tax=Sphingopyxis sp. L1A2A TaxID=2502247 RepID=UPI0010FA4C75|nr:hypothetical protein [Sphingopyxis sp. L1A2A]